MLASVAAFRAPASEPIWSEWAAPARTGARLVFYVTHNKDQFGTLGSFWTHALFNFLEDRLELEAFVALASAGLCGETTAREVVEAIQTRLDRPLEDAERVAMCVADRQAGTRVFAMLGSEACWAALIESEGTCVGIFVARSAQRPAG